MARLKLDESVEKFKEFYGRNISQMPKLIKEGRTPLSVAGLMQKRLEVLTSSENIRNVWWHNYFDTGDAVFYYPDGRFKIVLDDEIMRGINPKSKISMGALVLPDELYDKLEGAEFTRSEIERYSIAGKLLSKDETKSNPIWKVLAREDQALLNDYVDAVFTQTKRDKNMRIWLSQLQNKAVGWLWCIGGLNDFSLLCDGNLNIYYGGRFVGVAPEAP